MDVSDKLKEKKFENYRLLNDIQDLLDYMGEQSQHVPTVYDCHGCKYNTGLIKDKHCRGCRILNGDNWVYRQKPTKYEEEIITFTTQAGLNKNV